MFSFQGTIFILFLKLVTKLPRGDEEDRTLDPLRARQVLSQLSYAPIIGIFTSGHKWTRTTDLTLIRRVL